MANYLQKRVNGFKIPVYIFLVCAFLFYCGLLSRDGNYEGIDIPRPSSRRISSLLRDTQNKVSYDRESQSGLEGAPKSKLYDVTMGATGPILHDRHLVKDSQEESKCRLYSNTTLPHAQVDQLYTLTIEIDKDVVIQQTTFSVLAVGENHIFTANQSKYAVSSAFMTFTFTPTLPGVYNLFVEEIAGKTQLQIPGSPFRLVVEGDPVYAVELGRRADELPSCQTLLRTPISWIGGQWITRKIAGTKRGVLRSGWVFQPRFCSFDIFTTEDLALGAEKTSPMKIAILGSSVDRGIFFSLVDLLLATEEKYKLSESDFSQCWGMAQIQVGNLNIMYQDFRIENIFKLSQDGKSEVICHNEKEAKSGNYDFLDEAMRYVQNYLFAKKPWPDVFTVTVKRVDQLKLLLKAIPPSWDGIIYPLYNFKVLPRELYTKDGLNLSYQFAEELLSLDSRIQLIDGFGIGSGMRHNTESSPLIMKSNHWHKWCNELNGEMRVCGNPTEMIAQILLGNVIAPEGKETWLKAVGSNTKITFPRKITVCQDCPKYLLPFHVKPNPDLTCYVTTEGILENSSAKQEVWNGTLCPEECIKMEPVDVLYTQSGPVSVRRCTVNL